MSVVLLIMFGTLNVLSNPSRVFAQEARNSRMHIVLAEEFPTEENVGRLKLFDFPVDIFIAAKSISEFNGVKTSLEKFSNIGIVGYWPILDIKEGYWFSAFSKREGLERVIHELKNIDEPISVLWDAEVPHLRKRLFLTESPRFLGNRKIIQDFVTNPPEHVTLYIAENRKRSSLHRCLLKVAATTFDRHSTYSMAEMLYGKLNRSILERSLEEGVKKMGTHYVPIFGATAEGIGGAAQEGTWMRISPEILDAQLSLAKRFGIKTVGIYRLGGLDNEYVAVLKRYAGE